jgi:hypothetical protein
MSAQGAPGGNSGSSAELNLFVYLGNNPEGCLVTASPRDFVAGLKKKIQLELSTELRGVGLTGFSLQLKPEGEAQRVPLPSDKTLTDTGIKNGSHIYVVPAAAASVLQGKNQHHPTTSPRHP